MQRLILSTILVSVAAGAAGCSKTADTATATASGGVAIIDLDEVASRLGEDVKMADAIKARETLLNRQLAALEKSLQQQIEAKQKEIGETATPQQQQQLQQMRQQASLQLKNAQMKVSKDLTLHRSEVINGFRASTKPHAEQAARAKGMGIVVTRNENVIFTHLPGVEITEDVIARMSAKSAASTTNPAAQAKRPAAPVERAPVKR